jgi:zinc and cadmium transporter
MMPPEMPRFGVYAAWILALSFLAGIVPLLRRWTHDELQVLISLSTGIILGVVFLELLPELSSTTPGFFAAALVGFMMLLVLEKFVFIHPHETDELAGQRSGLAAYLGISFHSLLDGLALGSSTLVPALAPSVVFAILAHKVPDTFSLAGILTFFGFSRRRTLWMILLFSLLTPIGGVIALILLRGAGESTIGVLIGVATGTFLFIATTDLLPHTHAHHEVRFRNLAAVLTGVLLIGLTHRVRMH